MGTVRFLHAPALLELPPSTGEDLVLQMALFSHQQIHPKPAMAGEADETLSEPRTAPDSMPVAPDVHCPDAHEGPSARV